MRIQNADTKKRQQLNEDDIVKILTVKATEENSQKVITPLQATGANISAIGAKSDYEFVQKRASYLFKLLPYALRQLTKVYRFPGIWIKGAFIVSFIIGILSNYLGPQRLIHIIYNPLTILIAWNILVYVFMFIKSFFRFRIQFDTSQFENNKEEDNDYNDDEGDSHFVIDWLIGGLYKILFRFKAKFIDNNTKVTILKRILPAFWKSYKNVADKSLLLRFKSVMNVSAIGLLMGALLGVYFRGLFFNYNMIWLSTFISEYETIRNFLNLLYGMANFMIDGYWITDTQIQQLLLPDGAPAGPWIHKMALTSLIVIFIPRLILTTYYKRKAKHSLKPLNLSEEYYQQDILKDREKLIDVIREGIHEIISKKIKKTGETISEFVIKDYYEQFITPILLDFREKGGKIKDLESSLLKSQQRFEPILLNYLKDVQEEFRDGVLTELNLFLGRKLEIDINTMSTYQPKSDDIDQKLAGRIASDIGDTIGGTIVTTVSLAVGSISGGIGKSLGIAIISGLLGVSGPVGLLIGGVITAATLGGVYKRKRTQISALVKDIPLPAFAIKATLTDSKIGKTKKETYDHTEKEIKNMLEPKIEEVTLSILKDLTY
ncbi:MAG: hypothetical protein V2I62_08660 [Bacteroidales bacterium]|jgi:hypothetical protein|nr:hypothetical protein [Bacteroidales bacterium]